MLSIFFIKQFRSLWENLCWLQFYLRPRIYAKYWFCHLLQIRSGLCVAVTIALIFPMLSGCDMLQTAQKSTFNAVDVTGADYGKDFRLIDHKGKSRTLADFRGKAILLFFGFTHCADVCPTTLADANKVVKDLGGDGDRVQVLFVTLDPARDTPEVLGQYVEAFNASFLGLYGDDAMTRKMAKDFRVFYEQRSGATPENYSIDHMGGTLVFDPDGRLRLFLNYGMTPDKIEEDLRKLLS